MSQSGLIVRRNAGVMIPDEFLTLALQKFSKGWGAAFVADGGVTTAKGEDCNLDFVKETMTELKDKPLTLYFCSSDGALNEDDISPYTILEKDGVPQLVAFIDGKFPAHVKAGSSHPAEFFVINEYLIPKLKDVWELTDGNLLKVVEFINKPTFKNELLLNSQDRGAITLVAATGNPVSFTKGDTALEYPWGWVSNSLGFGAKEVKEEPKKSSSMFSKTRSTVREAAPAVQKTAASATVTPITAKTDTAIVTGYKVVTWKPGKAWSRSQKKDGYKSRLGYLPKGWNDGIEVQIYADNTGREVNMSEVKKLGLLAAGLPALNNPGAQNDRDHKDVTPEHVKEIPPQQSKTAVVPVQKAVSAEVFPILSPQDREYMKKMMADPAVRKIIGDNADIISDPTKVQALEQQFAGFASQLGMKKMDDFLTWTFPMFDEVAKNKPHIMACMAWTFKNIIASNMTKAARVAEVVEPVEAPKKPSMFARKAS